jgi:hypothetical protein
LHPKDISARTEINPKCLLRPPQLLVAVAVKLLRDHLQDRYNNPDLPTTHPQSTQVERQLLATKISP